jgi:hypothetical protein
MRIVALEKKGRKHSSKNPERLSPSMSRNVLGGFYAN